MKDLTSIARNLRSAYGAGAIAPLKTRLAELSDSPEQSVALAYEVQDTNTRFWEDNGRVITGRKIGLTSKTVQQQLGVDEPDYGILFDDMEYANGSTVSMKKLIQPKVEAEIAFKAATNIEKMPNSGEELAGMMSAAFPALEIVDSRIEDWKISLSDTVADNASSALYVLGDPVSEFTVADTVNATMQLYDNNTLVSVGKGEDCLGGPLKATMWLVEKMIEVGRPVQKGDVILSGALGPMVQVAAGSRYFSDIKGFGSVEINFA